MQHSVGAPYVHTWVSTRLALWIHTYVMKYNAKKFNIAFPTQIFILSFPFFFLSFLKLREDQHNIFPSSTSFYQPLSRQSAHIHFTHIFCFPWSICVFHSLPPLHHIHRHSYLICIILWLLPWSSTRYYQHCPSSEVHWGGPPSVVQVLYWLWANHVKVNTRGR